MFFFCRITYSVHFLVALYAGSLKDLSPATKTLCLSSEPRDRTEDMESHWHGKCIPGSPPPQTKSNQIAAFLLKRMRNEAAELSIQNGDGQAMGTQPLFLRVCTEFLACAGDFFFGFIWFKGSPLLLCDILFAQCTAGICIQG